MVFCLIYSAIHRQYNVSDKVISSGVNVLIIACAGAISALAAFARINSGPKDVSETYVVVNGLKSTFAQHFSFNPAASAMA